MKSSKRTDFVRITEEEYSYFKFETNYDTSWLKYIFNFAHFKSSSSNKFKMDTDNYVYLIGLYANKPHDIIMKV